MKKKSQMVLKCHHIAQFKGYEGNNASLVILSPYNQLTFI